MSVSVVFSVYKSAVADVHADAAATGKKVIALLADLGKQAEALGYNVKVKLRQRDAATVAPAVKAATPEWPRDLASSRWRP